MNARRLITVAALAAAACVATGMDAQNDRTPLSDTGVQQGASNTAGWFSSWGTAAQHGGSDEATGGGAKPAGHNGFSMATLNAITMTIATELGDKTFCIAAVMAMRYNRFFVFAGGIGALIVMSILSVVIGVAVPTVLPKAYTHYAAAALFAYFGVKLLREAHSMPASGEGGVNEELAEVEQEMGLEPESKKEEAPLTSVTVISDETAPLTSPSVGADTKTRSRRPGVGGKEEAQQSATANNDKESWWSSALASAAFHCSKEWHILTQAFTMTFLAEWGDRSQIATIAMAAAQNPFGVCLGAVVGHSLCTGGAVIGGRLLASKISERAVALMGGILFLIFALHSVIVGPEVDE